MVKAPRKVKYTPYTVSDYQKSQMQNKKINVGGLGNGQVGTDAWNERKQKTDRMKLYYEKVRKENAEKLRA
jgi:hypothetical protein